MNNYTEQEKIEYEVENALEQMRLQDFDKCSVYTKNRHKRNIKSGMEYLKQHYPDSYVLDLYMDDIDLTLE